MVPGMKPLWWFRPAKKSATSITTIRDNLSSSLVATSHNLLTNLNPGNGIRSPVIGPDISAHHAVDGASADDKGRCGDFFVADLAHLLHGGFHGFIGYGQQTGQGDDVGFEQQRFFHKTCGWNFCP